MKPKLVILAATAVATLVAYAAGPRIPLKIDYPKFVYGGTPKPVHAPNLEPSQNAPTHLLVSPQTVLLSRAKPVTSSDDNPVVGSLPFVTDGDRTSIDGTVVELGPGVQWVQIDLGAPARIEAIALWHCHTEPRAYHDVIVQISDDAHFRRSTAVYNNDHDNSAKLGRGGDRGYIETRFGRLIDAKGVSGRYVRLYSNGSTSDEMNHYAEVEVYGEARALAPIAAAGPGRRAASNTNATTR